MRDEFIDRGVIADNQAVEMPFLAKNIGEREGICGGWDPIEVVEGAHERAHSSVEGGFERRKINFAQGSFGNLSGVVVASAFRGTVSNPMFGARNHLVGLTVVRALKAT